eukprot:TRINITY_DN386_c0_g1_i8.p1 TRINITY_DN386_c0_g1~~TRINITY_DN386_c0_g1_i8.p1  ORF type:complete len:1404 (-),score=287.75 TRINITY_DN386_c0_g1_i8:242-4453(-)
MDSNTTFDYHCTSALVRSRSRTPPSGVAPFNIHSMVPPPPPITTTPGPDSPSISQFTPSEHDSISSSEEVSHTFEEETGRKRKPSASSPEVSPHSKRFTKKKKLDVELSLPFSSSSSLSNSSESEDTLPPNDPSTIEDSSPSFPILEDDGEESPEYNPFDEVVATTRHVSPSFSSEEDDTHGGNSSDSDLVLITTVTPTIGTTSSNGVPHLPDLEITGSSVVGSPTSLLIDSPSSGPAASSNLVPVATTSTFRPSQTGGTQSEMSQGVFQRARPTRARSRSSPILGSSPSVGIIVCPLCNMSVGQSHLSAHIDRHGPSLFSRDWLLSVNRTVCALSSCGRAVSTVGRDVHHFAQGNLYYHKKCATPAVRASLMTRLQAGEFNPRGRNFLANSSGGQSRVPPSRVSIGGQTSLHNFFAPATRNTINNNNNNNNLANFDPPTEPVLLEEEDELAALTASRVTKLGDIIFTFVPTIHFIPIGAIKEVGRAFRFACSYLNGRGDVPPLDLWFPLLAFAKTVLRELPKTSNSQKGSNAKIIKERALRFIQEGWESLWPETEKAAQEYAANAASIREGQSDSLIPGSRRWKDYITRKAQTSSLSSTFKCLSSEGVATSSAETLEKLRALHPERMVEIPDVEEGNPLINFGGVPLEILEKIIRSFPKGSAPGPDGFRPQYLKDLLKFQQKEDPHHVLSSLSIVVNRLVNGEAPSDLAPMLAGARLIPLAKKDGGIRPIAIGFTLRRVVSKVVVHMIKKQSADLLAPTQTGVAVSGGAEAIIEAVKAVDTFMDHERDFVILQADFRNAFNTISRAAFVRAAERHLPSIARWVRWCYTPKSNLLVSSADSDRPEVIKSEEGAQQGDPLGPLLFCLAIKDLTESIRSLPGGEAPLLNAWFFDDGTLAGSSLQVCRALDIIQAQGPAIGLSLNQSKSVLYWPAFKDCPDSPDRRDPFPLEFKRSLEGIVCLGAPIGNSSFIERHLMETSFNKSKVALERLRELEDPQICFALLRNCAGFCRINYLARSLDCSTTNQLSLDFDRLTESVLVNLLGVASMPGEALTQAQLPIREGGLGLRSSFSHLGAARLASVNANRGLVTRILRATQHHIDEEREVPPHSLVDEPLQVFAEAIATPPVDIAENVRDSKVQRELSTLIDSFNRQELLNKLPIYDKARVMSNKGRYGAVILNSVGIKAMGTTLTGHEFRTFIVHRLGLRVLFNEETTCPVCKSHKLDADGFHAAMCKFGGSLQRRHDKIRNIIYEFCRSAMWNPILEKEVIARGERAIPGDIFIPSAGDDNQGVAVDVTITHPQTERMVSRAAHTPLAAVMAAEAAKRAKHGQLCENAGITFVPFAIDFYGGVGPEAEAFIKRTAEAIAARRGGNRGPATGGIYRKIFFELARQNARAVLLRTEAN